MTDYEYGMWMARILAMGPTTLGALFMSTGVYYASVPAVIIGAIFFTVVHLVVDVLRGVARKRKEKGIK